MEKEKLDVYMGMGINKAFEHLLATPKWERLGGWNNSYKQTIRKRFKDGVLTLDKMRAILKVCRYEIVQEEKWEAPRAMDIKHVNKTNTTKKNRNHIILRTFVEPEFIETKTIIKIVKKPRTKTIKQFIK